MAYEGAPISTFLFDKLRAAPTRRTFSLYVPQWQQMRISFKGRWSDPVQMYEILDELREYVKESVTVDDISSAMGTAIGARITRLWRIVNMLDAVYMGWPNKELNTKAQLDFLAFKAQMASEYHGCYEALGPGLRTNEWEWKVLIGGEDFNTAWADVPPNAQHQIALDLIMRFKNAMKRTKAPKQGIHGPFAHTLVDRPELFWFLERIVPNRAKEMAFSTLKGLQYPDV